MARVSFAYNDWQQQIGPGAIINPNDETPGTNASGGYAGSLNAHWQFNVSGMVELPLGIAASVNFYGRQGFPTPYTFWSKRMILTSTRPLFRSGNPRSYRTPNVYEVDLQLSKTFAIGPAVAVTPQFACFNLLDSRTILARDGTVGTYDAERETPFKPDKGFDDGDRVLGPRAFRGGLRVTF